MPLSVPQLIGYLSPPAPNFSRCTEEPVCGNYIFRGDGWNLFFSEPFSVWNHGVNTSRDRFLGACVCLGVCSTSSFPVLRVFLFFSLIGTNIFFDAVQLFCVNQVYWQEKLMTISEKKNHSLLGSGLQTFLVWKFISTMFLYPLSKMCYWPSSVSISCSIGESFVKEKNFFTGPCPNLARKKYLRARNIPNNGSWLGVVHGHSSYRFSTLYFWFVSLSSN